MNAERFYSILAELIDENPFAIRAVLKILAVEFTTTIPTLAVTCEARPRLLVNLAFLTSHCRRDVHVKAVICHEFLHVLLRLTETHGPLTAARHLAFDAVINAIIHRQYGPTYSAMMANYYAEVTGLQKLLRPMTAEEDKAAILSPIPWVRAWSGLYEGSLVADDIESLALDLGRTGRSPTRKGKRNGRGKEGPSEPDLFSNDCDGAIEIGDLLGNHADLGKPLSDALQGALDQAMKEMNGAGIWRDPGSRGIGANPYEALFNADNEPLLRWQRITLAVLRRHLTPDSRSRARIQHPHEYRIPVLSPGDRRAFMKSLWTPFLPEATWHTEVRRREGTAQVYLDVSGSMNAEMPHLIALLGRLGRNIRRPFWAFSTLVAPAVIEAGQLKTTTSGGTSMSCVLAHIEKNRPLAAVVVTDGYIERLDPAQVAGISHTKLHVLVTRDGSPAELHRAGLPYTQLERLPS